MHLPETIEARLWDSESRKSPYSTVADVEDESYCEVCDSEVVDDGSEYGRCKCNDEVDRITIVEEGARDESPRVVSHLGGKMYGDGEYVVEFENVGSMQAPLVACVLTPGGHGYSMKVEGLPAGKRAAEIVIARVRADEKARG